MDPIAVDQEGLAELLGCCKTKVREMTPELPHFRHGKRIFYPVDAVRQYLNKKGFETLEAERKRGAR